MGDEGILQAARHAVTVGVPLAEGLFESLPRCRVRDRAYPQLGQSRDCGSSSEGLARERDESVQSACGLEPHQTGESLVLDARTLSPTAANKPRGAMIVGVSTSPAAAPSPPASPPPTPPLDLDLSVEVPGDAPIPALNASTHVSPDNYKHRGSLLTSTPQQDPQDADEDLSEESSVVALNLPTDGRASGALAASRADAAEELSAISAEESLAESTSFNELSVASAREAVAAQGATAETREQRTSSECPSSGSIEMMGMEELLQQHIR